MNLIYTDLVQFLHNKERETIKNLNDIITNINNGQLNFYKKIIGKYNKLIIKFKEKAVKRSLIKNSLIFKAIYNINLELFKTNDEKCIEETETKFGQLFVMFSENGIHSLNQGILQICLDSIKSQSKQVIDKEVEILIKYFQSKLFGVIYDKEKIIRSMYTIYKGPIILYYLKKKIFIKQLVLFLFLLKK